MVQGLTVIKVKGRCRWAIRATIQLADGSILTRYRGFHYKRDAVNDFKEWDSMSVGRFYPRNFNHNFNTAEELNIREIT